jgi:hypothetical protein
MHLDAYGTPRCPARSLVFVDPLLASYEPGSCSHTGWAGLVAIEASRHRRPHHRFSNSQQTRSP